MRSAILRRSVRLLPLITGVLASMALASPARAERVWHAPEPLPGNAELVTGLAAGPQGQALLAWTEGKAGERQRLHAVFRPPGSPWGVPEVVAEMPYEERPGLLSIAFSPAGDATIVYPTPENGGIGAIDRSRAGGYGRPVTVTDRGADMRFATNGRGDAIVLWTRDAPNQTTTWVSVRRAGEDWSPGLQVPTAQRFSQPLVELDDAGTATVVWTESDEPPEPCTPGPGYCPDDERVRAMTLSPARSGRRSRRSRLRMPMTCGSRSRPTVARS